MGFQSSKLWLRLALDRAVPPWADIALALALAAGLALCYRGAALAPIAIGLLLFGGMALLRIDLALLFVPLTVPLFLVSAALPVAPAPELLLPPHELALLVAAAAALLRAGAFLYRHPRARLALAGRMRRVWAWLPQWLATYAPELLFLVAGTIGLLIGAPEPDARRDALRAFRWFVVEPLLFVTLIRLLARRPAHAVPYRLRLARALVLGGAIVALLGLFQSIGYHLAVGPGLRLGIDGSFAGGALRATSVYGNPNNLGLYLGRVWPVAAALAAFQARSRERAPGNRRAKRQALFFALCSLLCLGGILVSFSRGAWVGVGAALVVLALPYARRKLHSRLLACLIVGGAALALVGGLIFMLRGGLAGGSTTVRLLFWRESIALVEQHPLGLGLDQFFYYHHPAFGRSQIDPLLANTQERYARQPHDLIFELWLNLGPAGLLAVAWLMARGLRRGVSALGQSPAERSGLLARGALAALVAALAHGTVDAFYFWPDIAIAFWLLLVLLECPNSSPEIRGSRAKGNTL